MNTPRKTLISTSEIAALADVDISTVSNWRKRFATEFPSPQLADDLGKRPKFDRDEVLAWLARNPQVGGQRDSSDESAADVMDSLRDFFPSYEAVDLVGRLLVLAELRHRHGTVATRRLTSEEIRSAIDEADSIASPASQGRLDTSQLVPNDILEDCYERVARVQDRLGYYDSLLFGRTSRASVLGEHTTPLALADFMLALLPAKSEHIYDPAAGYGELIRRAIKQGRASTGFGIDVNLDAVTIANRRFFLSGVSAEIVAGSSLTRDPAHGQKFDLVLADPPLSMPIPRDERESIDARQWIFATPPTSNADFAWLQHAIAHLKEQGRAVVVTAIGALFRTDNASATIRTEMVRRGAIEAIIALPGGSRQNTGIRLAVWVLCAPDRADRRNAVLLVDAGERDTSVLAADGKVARMVRDWLNSPDVELDPTVASAVPVTDLLAPDATLMPNRWTESVVDSLSHDEWRDKVRDTYNEALDASESVEQLPDLEIVATEEEFRRTTLGELQKTGTIQIIKGRYAERIEEVEGPSYAMLTVKQVRPDSNVSLDDAEKVPQSPATAAQLVQPGDVVVYPDGSTVRARVWREEGWVLGRFMQIVRLASDQWTPEYVAASINNPANERFLMGTAIRTHFKLTEFQLVILPVERQVRMAAVERQLTDAESLLAAAAAKVGRARDDLLQAITSGVVYFRSR